MTGDDLEVTLRAWGRVFGERASHGDPDDRPARAVHAIARGMEFAPGKRQTVIRQHTSMHRCGSERRATMAIAAGGASVGLRVVSPAYCDPIPCTETRSGRSESRDWPVPPQIARVERAALDLLEIHRLRGWCLRVNYCTRGDRDTRRAAVSAGIGVPVTAGQFRAELSYARVWMHARLSG